MRHITTVLTAALLLALTACTGSEDDRAPSEKPTPTPTTTPTAERTAQQPADDTNVELERAVHAYADVYFKPDAKAAYAMLSTRCQEALAPEAYKPIVEAAAKKHGKQHVRLVRVDLVSGDLAFVTYSYDAPELDQQQQPWKREEGQWRYDEC
ncbi:hypothetical protein [Streptomyces sp. NPDC002889]|uniref:hypothetical protein n=1 Tax=Streptomyces sp. NPDC002889 TaxID=3364669 RepID=UPI003689A2A1